MVNEEVIKKTTAETIEKVEKLPKSPRSSKRSPKKERVPKNSEQNANDGKKSEPENGNDKSKRKGGRRPPSNRRRDSYVPYEVLLRQHEEAQKLKQVLDTNVTGTVKWFSMRFHYGFIARDDGKGDVFVHQMNIIKSRMKKVYFRSLAPDEKVEFDVVQGKAGPEAAQVTGLNGTEVQGRRPYFRPRKSGQRRRNESGRDDAKESATDSSPDKSTDKPKRRFNRRKKNNTGKKDPKGEENKVEQAENNEGPKVAAN